jgi:UDP-N-acetylmuramoylalanine--D-glutamate ligase
MINLREFNGKKIGIFGLGKTGTGCLKALLNTNAQVTAWDNNKQRFLDLKTNISSDKKIYFSDVIDPIDVKKLDFVIVSPGIPYKYPNPHKIFTICQKHNIPIVTDIDILFKACPKADYVGITGTNGKSTTTSLINHILQSNNYKSALGSNIGIPALNLPNFNNSNEHYILELSSYQLDLMLNYKFNIAALLSITPDHLDRYASFEDYKNAKLRIFNNQNHNDFAIISLNNHINKDIYNQLIIKKTQTIIPTSSQQLLKKGISVIKNKLYDNYFENQAFSLDLPNSLIGQHNAENIAMAYTIAKIINLNSKQIIKNLGSYIGLPHRMELFLKTEKLSFVNDSKATNIASTKEALRSFKNIHWIAGGVFKEKNLEELNNHLSEVRHCYLIGQDYEKFIPLLEKNNIPYSICNNLENSIQKIKNSVKSGTILLSPCCASFDQWKNFEERGDAFKNLILENYS